MVSVKGWTEGTTTIYAGNSRNHRRIAPFEAMYTFIREAPPTEFADCIAITPDLVLPCKNTLTLKTVANPLIQIDYEEQDLKLGSFENGFINLDSTSCPVLTCHLK